MKLAAGGVAAAGLAAVAAFAAAGGGEAPRAAEPEPKRGTATVERRDLVDRESIAGTLGFADSGTLAAGVAGTLTGVREPGAVITRGHSLYAVNGAPAAFLLYGSLPAWRDFRSGMSSGDDVRQLERNLRALGYDPGDVDSSWTWETTEAVKDFQRDRELSADGTLAQGEVVFRSGPARIGEAKAAVGDALSPGLPLAEISSRQRQVTVALDARRQELAKPGGRVVVELPNGRTARGRITDVGAVATKGEERTTVEVTIAISGHGSELDQAPVEVGFEIERARGALAVPVKALLARQGGGYALELPDGRMVPVSPGLYADDLVEVEGDGLREGMRVVTAE